eukprot:Lankesteria_metandrocarpae@DN5366_c0_g1_i1.p1
MIQVRRLKWFGHVCRTDHSAMPRQILFGRLPQTRPVGGPQLRWLDQIAFDLEEWKLDWTRAEQCTANEWNAMVDRTQPLVANKPRQLRTQECRFCNRHLAPTGVYNHERFCKSNPNATKSSKVAESARVHCRFCHQLFDPRGIKNHEKKCGVATKTNG